MGEFLTSNIPTNFSLSGVLKNTFLVQEKRGLVEGLLIDVFD